MTARPHAAPASPRQERALPSAPVRLAPSARPSRSRPRDGGRALALPGPRKPRPHNQQGQLRRAALALVLMLPVATRAAPDHSARRPTPAGRGRAAAPRPPADQPAPQTRPAPHPAARPPVAVRPAAGHRPAPPLEDPDPGPDLLARLTRQRCRRRPARDDPDPGGPPPTHPPSTHHRTHHSRPRQPHRPNPHQEGQVIHRRLPGGRRRRQGRWGSGGRPGGASPAVAGRPIRVVLGGGSARFYGPAGPTGRERMPTSRPPGLQGPRPTG